VSEHTDDEGATIFQQACKMALEGIVLPMHTQNSAQVSLSFTVSIKMETIPIGGDEMKVTA
jgi:hypothetical protein